MSGIPAEMNGDEYRVLNNTIPFDCSRRQIVTALEIHRDEVARLTDQPNEPIA